MAKATTTTAPETHPAVAPTVEKPAKRDTAKLKARYEALAEKVQQGVKDLKSAERLLLADVKKQLASQTADFEALKAEKLAAFTAYHEAEIADQAEAATKGEAV